MSCEYPLERAQWRQNRTGSLSMKRSKATLRQKTLQPFRRCFYYSLEYCSWLRPYLLALTLLSSSCGYQWRSMISMWVCLHPTADWDLACISSLVHLSIIPWPLTDIWCELYSVIFTQDKISHQFLRRIQSQTTMFAYIEEKSPKITPKLWENGRDNTESRDLTSFLAEDSAISCCCFGCGLLNLSRKFSFRMSSPSPGKRRMDTDVVKLYP